MDGDASWRYEPWGASGLGLQRADPALERLLEIQRAIGRRAPTRTVLEAVTAAAAGLRGAAGATLSLCPAPPAGGPPPELDLRGEPALLVVGRSLAAPVRRDGRLAGWLEVDAPDPEAFGERGRRWLLMLAEHASLALSGASAAEAIRLVRAGTARRAARDPLTRLASRAAIMTRLRDGLDAAEAGLTLVLVDLDRFQAVNDAFGHAAGDELLRVIGARLRAVVRERDLVGRFDGDEFAVVGAGLDPAGAEGLVRRVAAALAAPVTLAGAAHSPSARLGVAAAEPGDSPEDVVRHAGLALRRAGGDGGSDRARGAAGEGAGVFDPGLRAAQADLQAAASRLRAALAGEELTLHFQPVVELPAERLHGREALVRWRQPDGRVLPPAAFLDAAVQAGLGAAVDRWVLDRACAAAAGWAPGVGVSVNVSAAQFADPDLVGVVGRAVRQHALDPARLTLEITETALLRRTDWTQATLQELRRLGVRLAVDDFGAGYSSLSYLHHFELDAIKIDRSFVSRLGADRQAEGIVRAILHLAAALELEVVAEGVERDEQLERLLALTPSAPVRLHGQGYLFGRPGPDGGGRLGNLPSEVAGGAAVPRPCRYAERFEQRVV